MATMPQRLTMANRVGADPDDPWNRAVVVTDDGPAPKGSNGTRREPGELTRLVRAAAAGDQRSWDEIVDRFTNLLWSVARGHRLDQADAADVVQTTWLQLVEHLDRIQDPECLPGWLATTARHASLHRLKRGGREVVAPTDDLAIELPDRATPALDAALLESERDAVLWECFGRLKDECQQLLRALMGADPMSYDQICEAFGMPKGSIGPTRMRCLKRLREIAATDGRLESIIERSLP